MEVKAPPTRNSATMSVAQSPSHASAMTPRILMSRWLLGIFILSSHLEHDSRQKSDCHKVVTKKRIRDISRGSGANWKSLYYQHLCPEKGSK